jgi:hypothetical protein
VFVLEVLPLVAGGAVGLGLHRLGAGRFPGTASLAAISLVLGAAISALAGELAVSPAYVVWDGAQVFVGALGMRLGLQWRARRRRSAAD